MASTAHAQHRAVKTVEYLSYKIKGKSEIKIDTAALALMRL